MRIISGSLGGRQFDAPKGHRTHPMSDKMRGALFNMLGDITNLDVLDAFAGSGALGFEALSRGAKRVIAIESDKTAHRIMEANARTLSLDNTYKPIRASVAGWSSHNPDNRFDIVLADPPYEDSQAATLKRLSNHVSANGLLVLSWPGHKQPLEFNDLKQLMQHNYGDSQLVFYRKTS